MSKEAVDIIVQIPLEMEFNAFLDFFKHEANLTEDEHATYRVQAPHGLKVVVTLQREQGRLAASAACQAALIRFDPKLYIIAGIAGGLSKDLKLGDVAYTGTLLDVYDNAKMTDSPDGGLDIHLRPEHYTTPRSIEASMGFVRTMPEFKPYYENWQDERLNAARHHGLCEIKLGNSTEQLKRPISLNGDLVCGSVSASVNYKEKLKGVTRNILAVETEAGAVFAECKKLDIAALCVRGVSDYSDDVKKSLEDEHGSLVRKLAAENAMSFIKLQFDSSLFRGALDKVVADKYSKQIPLFANTAQPKFPQLLQDSAKYIDAQLRELSPQFKTKPENFRLPTPRLRRIPTTPGAIDRNAPASCELLAALHRSRNVLIHVPRAYPDPGLAWILANGLLLSELNGEKIIPVVVQGGKISPPQNSPFKKSKVPLLENVKREGGIYVYIVDEPPTTSNSKLAYLIKCIQEDDESRYVILSKADKSVVDGTDLRRGIAAESYDLCNISFAEMAAYLENCLEMPGVEAEVVALKLRETFDQFSLPAHPSFFAGISSEVIAALLHANRRSELIQLAVDGFLSFIVAADKDPVRLSRSKRSQFLRNLILEMSLEKRVFTQADLVAFADQLNKKFDYGIQPISFVQGFVDKGLLHFENDNVKVTLPFMNSYLLADELSKDQSKARRYFDVSDAGSFDTLTFDLYAEIGASDQMMDLIIGELQKSRSTLPSMNGEHILLSDELQPVLFKNPVKLRSLESRVLAARKALEDGESDRDSKIKILDIADRINEDISLRSREYNEEVEERFQPQVHLLQTWNIAAILLGSGAEGIEGDRRKALVQEILTTADILLHHWTKDRFEQDYDLVRKSIIADVDFKKDVGLESDKDFEALVSALTDFIQFFSISQPATSILSILLDQAQHLIIGNSVARAEPKSNIEGLIKGLWLSHIDRSAGSSLLNKSIKELPKAQFLRTVLAQMLIMRVKWNTFHGPLRHYLIDVAEDILKPLREGFDKGELRRLVQKLDDERVSMPHRDDIE